MAGTQFMSNTESEGPPPRFVTRLVIDCMVETAPLIAKYHGGELVRGVVFLALMQANRTSYASLRRNPAGRTGSNGALKPISINALAQSLAMPAETVRRYLLKLVAADRCVRMGGKGYVVPDSVLEQPWFGQFADRCYVLFLRMIGDFKAMGFDFGALGKTDARPEPHTKGNGATGTFCPAAGEISGRLYRRVVLDFVLRIIECGIPLHNNDILSAVVYSAIMSANAKAITNDPVNAWRYATHRTPPPDALRKPVSVLHIAALLGAPYETVRRHVGDLVAGGKCVRVGKNGILLRMSEMQRPEVLQSGKTITLRFVQVIAALKTLGFDFAAVDETRKALAAE